MNRKPQIVHIVPALFGENGIFGGAERYTFELARHMAKSAPTTLVSFGDEPRQFTTPEGLSVKVLAPAWKVRGQQFNRIHPGIARAVLSADIVHCHQPHTLAAELSAILARVTGRRVFATDLGGGGWGFSGYARTDSWFDGHLHISAYSERIAGHGGMKGSEVIYGGVDAQLFSPSAVTPKEPVVVFVGRILPHKGVDDLIAALPDGLALELIGRSYDERYQASLHQLAEGKRVTFRHDCDDAEIIHAYRRAMCVVLPSVYRDMYGHQTAVPELLGQTLLEGMACGTPAICTDVASMPELVDHGSTGFVVPPNDSAALRGRLEFLRDNPSESDKMGQAARRCVVEKFNWPSVVSKCLAAYRR
ncbi:MAG: glycosyltransferase family 4 protein [Gemmatimonadales bacterium]